MELYSLSSDFGNNIDIGQLYQTIKNNVGFTTIFGGISQYDDVVNIIFMSQITNEEKTLLNSIVSSHVPIVYVETNVVKLSEFLPIGTNGGTFTQNTWQVRNLNTIEPAGNISWCSLSNNEFTLSPNSYLLTIKAPAYKVDDHAIRLYNVSNLSQEAIGRASYTKSTSGNSNVATLEYALTITGTTNRTYRIEHQCSKTNTNEGLGRAGGIGTEVYTTVLIEKK